MFRLLRNLRGKKKQQPKPTPVPAFNIVIDIEGWEGPFDSLEEFEGMAHKVSIAESQYVGQFHVLSSSRLSHGFKEGVHTYKGEVDLRDQPIHVHYGHRIDDIYFTSEGTFFGRRDRVPKYTLQGLYKTLPNDKTSTRISALRSTLESRVGYKFDSIATRKEVQLRLLENQYRRRISDQ